jgi:hypothetical protein
MRSRKVTVVISVAETFEPADGQAGASPDFSKLGVENVKRQA